MTDTARRCTMTATLLLVAATLVACSDSAPHSDGRSVLEPDRLTGADSESDDPAAGDAAAVDSPSDGVCWASTPPPGDGVAFADVTAEFGLVEPLTGMYGHATAIADVDGDGWSDLFVGGFADRPDENYQVRGASGPAPDRILLGGPEGFRVDESFPGERARTSGATFADLDGDGDLDLVVVRNPRGDDDIQRRPTTLYERVDGSWRAAATLGDDVAGRSVATLDVDRDGRLDLAIAGDRFGPGASRLFRNLGDFEFEDATSQWGMPDDLETLALAVVDLDDDGWPDIVASGDERVLLGRERGFDVNRQPALTWDVIGEEDDAAGIAVGDLDGDGLADLVVGQHFNSTVDADALVPVRVYLNRTTDGELDLLDVTEEVGSPPLWTKSPHVAIADIDNDGKPDIVTSAAAADGAPVILRSVGDDTLRFEMVGERGDGSYWVTGVSDDIDHDGRLDVFMVAWEPATASPLFANQSGSGHWIEVGVPTPTSIVSIRSPDGESITRGWAQSTTGYAAGAAAIVRFGLGDLDVDHVDVTISTVEGDRTVRVPVDARTDDQRCG